MCSPSTSVWAPLAQGKGVMWAAGVQRSNAPSSTPLPCPLLCVAAGPQCLVLVTGHFITHSS